MLYAHLFFKIKSMFFVNIFRKILLYLHFFVFNIKVMYKKIWGLFVFTGLLLASLIAWGQDKSILDQPAAMKAMLERSSFSIDASAQAVVLYEKGEYILTDAIPTYKLERIVKITGTEGVSEFAAVDIPASQSSVVRKVRAETFNLDQGEIAKQAIEKTDILNDKTTSSMSVIKFNLPGVKPGSVIHYTYIVEYPPFFPAGLVLSANVSDPLFRI